MISQNEKLIRDLEKSIEECKARAKTSVRTKKKMELWKSSYSGERERQVFTDTYFLFDPEIVERDEEGKPEVNTKDHDYFMASCGDGKQWWRSFEEYDIDHQTDYAIDFTIDSGTLERDVQVRFEKHENGCWHPVVPHLEEKILSAIEDAADSLADDLRDSIGEWNQQDMKTKVVDTYDKVRDNMTCWLEHTLDGFESDMEEIIQSYIESFNHDIDAGTYDEELKCPTC